MLGKEETQTGPAAEIKIVPAWAWVLTGIGFVSMQFVFNVVLAHRSDAPPSWARPLLGLLVGLVLGCFLLFIGYISRDAKRRGMSPVLWTIVAVVIPNALGIILYFVLRQPVRSACPQCGNAVQIGFSFCPRCSYKLGPSCPQCQRAVGMNDVYCPYCGISLRNQEAPVSNPATRLPG
ncbi:MAG TPA: zinc ribbon domain-containing protein [Terriglobales bacterium]|nr:zinc ribbon domain-containing protein [Terriglobales bacterium]